MPSLLCRCYSGGRVATSNASILWNLVPFHRHLKKPAAASHPGLPEEVPNWVASGCCLRQLLASSTLQLPLCASILSLFKIRYDIQRAIPAPPLAGGGALRAAHSDHQTSQLQMHVGGASGTQKYLDVRRNASRRPNLTEECSWGRPRYAWGVPRPAAT